MIDLKHIHTVADVTRYGAHHRPESVAIEFQGKLTTYRELDEHASRVGNGFLGEGCTPAARIAILAKNSDMYIEIIFGAAKDRAVSVCVNWRLAPPEIVFVLNNAQARVLFVGKDYYDVIEKIRPELPHIHTIIALDGGHREWVSYQDWRKSHSAEDPKLDEKPDDTSIQMYTSGTTGLPKGVEITNKNMMAFFSVVDSMAWSNFGEGAKLLIVMPLFHSAGLNCSLMGFAQGGHVLMQRDFDARMLIEIVREHRVTHVQMVPAVMLFVLQQPEIKNADFSSVQYIVYGAAPMNEDLLRESREVFGCGFAQIYGLTETTGVGTCLTPDDHEKRPEKLKSCGRASKGIQIRLLKPDGTNAKPGEVGEVLVKGDCITKGYWNKPEVNAETIVDGWLHTGDAAYMDEEGYLYIHDGVKEMIISGGENIYPAEVESALFSHPKIADVAIIGVPDDKWGESVKAIVVVKKGEKLTPEEIIAFARERIAAYKCPKTVDFIDVLPRNPSGKILRRDLRKPYWEGRDRLVS